MNITDFFGSKVNINNYYLILFLDYSVCKTNSKNVQSTMYICEYLLIF